MNKNNDGIWHPFWLWEEVRYNMWGEVENKKQWLEKAINFTGDHRLYGYWMFLVAENWKYSCEHNLTKLDTNRISSLEAELAKTENEGEFFPKEGEEFWVASWCGALPNIYHRDCFSSEIVLSFYKIFKTKVEAEKECEKLRATRRVERKLAELRKGEKLDWNDYGQDKWTIYYNYEIKIFGLTNNQFWQYSNLKMYSTKKACQWVIDHMQDDLKLMFDIE